MSVPIRMTLYTVNGEIVSATTLFTVWYDVANNINIPHRRIREVRNEIISRYPTVRYVSPDTTPDYMIDVTNGSLHSNQFR